MPFRADLPPGGERGRGGKVQIYDDRSAELRPSIAPNAPSAPGMTPDPNTAARQNRPGPNALCRNLSESGSSAAFANCIQEQGDQAARGTPPNPRNTDTPTPIRHRGVSNCMLERVNACIWVGANANIHAHPFKGRAPKNPRQVKSPMKGLAHGQHEPPGGSEPAPTQE